MLRIPEDVARRPNPTFCVGWHVVDGSPDGAVNVMNPCATATAAAQNLLIKANTGRARGTAQAGVFVQRQIGAGSLFMLSKTHKRTHGRKYKEERQTTQLV